MVVRLVATSGIALLMALTAVSCVSTGARKGDEDPYADLVWPPPPDEPRIKLEEVIRGRADVEASSKLRRRLLGAAPLSPYDWLQKPFAVAFDPEGRILVTDSETAALIRFDRAGRRMDVLGTRGAVTLKLPLGLDVAPDGTIYVADAARRQVVAFEPDGRLHAVYGRQGELVNPTDAALSPDGSRLYVADSKAHRIVVFDPVDGRLVTHFGQRGEGKGEFGFPTSLAFGRDGSLYVVDQINSRVQVLGPNGRFLEQFGNLGVGFASFVRPKDVVVDELGWIYVSDNAFNNFQLFDSDYRLLTFVGEGGQEPGRFLGASGLAVRGETVAAVDQLGARVQVFRFLIPKAETARRVALGRPMSPEPGAPIVTEAMTLASQFQETVSDLEERSTPGDAPPRVLFERRSEVEKTPEVEPAPADVQADSELSDHMANAEFARSNAEAVLRTVHGWSRTWANQHVDDYLAFYSIRFQPAGATSRESWEAVRKQRLTQPSRIDVSLDSPQVELPSPEHALVTFLQTYRSDRFSDRVLKTLELVLEAGEWRILRESVLEVIE